MMENMVLRRLEKKKKSYFKMKFPEKYIKYGERTLHSGGRTDIFYDVNALLTDRIWIGYLLGNLPRSNHYVGIATGGAIIAALVARERKVKFSMVKDEELKGEVPVSDYLLVDDVVTTGSSLEEAISIVGKTPKEIVVVLDRRNENKNPEVHSIFEI